MAKVKALHEIHRVSGVVTAGTVFEATGEELAYLRSVGAVSSDIEDAEVVETAKPKAGKKAATEQTDDLGLE